MPKQYFKEKGRVKQQTNVFKRRREETKTKTDFMKCEIALREGYKTSTEPMKKTEGSKERYKKELQEYW